MGTTNPHGSHGVGVWVASGGPTPQLTLSGSTVTLHSDVIMGQEKRGGEAMPQDSMMVRDLGGDMAKHIVTGEQDLAMGEKAEGHNICQGCTLHAGGAYPMPGGHTQCRGGWGRLRSSREAEGLVADSHLHPVLSLAVFTSIHNPLNVPGRVTGLGSSSGQRQFFNVQLDYRTHMAKIMPPTSGYTHQTTNLMARRLLQPDTTASQTWRGWNICLFARQSQHSSGGQYSPSGRAPLSKDNKVVVAKGWQQSANVSDDRCQKWTCDATGSATVVERNRQT
ncbi:hypothetical protein EDD15DRAFT_2524604 [Pisolithus albus]|nr:hypothetical protein EDD15DRAFT_2524604 [Pisolithus albus]